ncbi:carbohydrate kinase family protein [Staphylothermus hellenicus]|uniref:PfkB domain protein n=1 Tax=Staphylothermus hellenicus (strain DSM 12710 / JCM 10830 / BK20S6-10-b1 / P8) TaxID=591019 RepID=D7DBC5_STAHD|nr:PfkB family carbohydrate kinase [Staphylothermus hellenicus]ADI31472.1 PfkB domain protein [Staphylothermus hellenicus DSM 12710]
MPKTSSKPIHVAVGNLNIDITMYVSRLPMPDESVFAEEIMMGPGGSASNYSIAVTYYGHTAYLIASTSLNQLVDSILEKLNSIGVITRFVKRVEENPGIVNVVVIPGGEKIMVKYRGANELLSPNDVPKQLLEEATIVHMASIPPTIASEIAMRATGLGALVSYDPGAYALYDEEKIVSILDNINILFLNRAEARSITGGKIENLLKYGTDLIVIKKGPGGAYVLQQGGTVYHGVSKPIRPPIDSTGAGDAFDAFFNAAYIDYKDLGKALSYALAAGALKVMCRGSILCWDKHLFSKQLNETIVEEIKEPENWILED